MRWRSCIRHSKVVARAENSEKVTCVETAATAGGKKTIDKSARPYPRFVIVMTGR